MNRLISVSTAIILALIFSGAQAATKTEKRIDNAVDVFSAFTQIPEQGIPSRILEDAYGIAIIPGVIKVGFTIGGRYGRGVLMVRQEDGNWSNPSFVSMGGGSVGFQIGAQSTDIVLVFRDKRSVDNIFKGKLTLGGDASAAAGPVGRQTSAATDGRLSAEIYSYSRNRGLFAGVALDGAWIGMDKKSNEAYYGNGMSPQEILAATDIPTPPRASQLVGIVSATVPMPDQQMPARPAMATTESSEQVTTYALEPIDTTGDPVISGTGDETQF